MKTRSTLYALVAAAVLVFGFSGTAGAVEITEAQLDAMSPVVIDFDDVADRTAINTQYSGLTFSTEDDGDPLAYASTGARSSPNYLTGDLLFSTNIILNFSMGIDALGADWVGVDEAFFTVYSGLNLTGGSEILDFDLYGGHDFFALDPDFTIRSAETGGYFFAIDDLKYVAQVPVPEPATILLIGTGLVGLVGFRKKFKK